MKQGKALEQTSEVTQEATTYTMTENFENGFRIYQDGEKYRITFINEIVSREFETEKDAIAYYESKPYELILTACMVLYQRMQTAMSLKNIEDELETLKNEVE